MNSNHLNSVGEKMFNQNNLLVELLKEKMKLTENENSYRLKNFSDTKITKTNYIYFKCTKCDKSFQKKIEMGGTISIHPILEVLMCDSCCNYYGDGNFSMGSDGEDKYCRWCGEGGTIFSCSKCICGFCENCIKKHFGEETLEQIIKDDDWKCYFCNPKPLWFLRGISFLAKSISKNNKNCTKRKRNMKILNENKGNTSFSEDDDGNQINSLKKECKRKKISNFNYDLSQQSLQHSKIQKEIIENQFPILSHENVRDSNIFQKDYIKGLWKLIEIVSEIGLNESRANLKSLNESNSSKPFINLQKECGKLKNVLSIILEFLNKASDSIVLLKENSNFVNEELKFVESSLWIEIIKKYINSKEFNSSFTLKILASALNSAIENVKTMNLKESVQSDSRWENFQNSSQPKITDFYKNNKKEMHLKISQENSPKKKQSEITNNERENNYNPELIKENLHDKNVCSNLCEENNKTLNQKIGKKIFFDSDWEDSFTDSSSDCEQTSRKKKIIKKENLNQYSKNFSAKSFSDCHSEEQELQTLLKMSNIKDKEKNLFQKLKEIKTPHQKKPQIDNLKKNQEQTSMDYYDNNCEKQNYETDEEVIKNIKQEDFEAGANAGLKSLYLMSSEDSLVNSEKEEERPEKKKNKQKLEEKVKPKRKLANSNFLLYFYSSSSESEKEKESNSTESEKRNIKQLINSDENNFTFSKFDNCDVEQISKTSKIMNQQKGRKDIKRILKKEDLKLETKEARKLESDRKKRIAEREKNFEKEFSTESIKLILDYDLETKNELLTVDENLAKKLKPHQRSGINFMWNCCFESLERIKEDKGSGCILAHCMGLGKTFQVITLVHTLLSQDTGIKSVMIMTPLNILNNWISEFKYWLTECDYQILPYYITSGNKKQAKLAILKKWINNGGVLLIGYETFRSMVNTKYYSTKYQKKYSVILNPGPDVVILDEGHLLKNSNSSLTQSVAQIRTLRRIILTGTPLQNNLLEYYCMVNFVKPNILGTKREFMNRFLNPIKNGQFEDSTEHDVRLMKRRVYILYSFLSSFVQRLGFDVLKSFLPEKREYVIKVALTKKQDLLYRIFLEKCIYKYKLWNNFNVLEKLWTHPLILAKTIHSHESFDWSQHVKQEELNDIKISNKLILLFKILQGCKKLGDKVIVFSQFLTSLDIIEYFLKQQNEQTGNWIPGINYFRLDGSTKMENRSNYCKRFNDQSENTVRLFLVATRAGGLGINMIAANRVVLFDVSWNPMNDLQSIFRVYRFGQNKSCYIYRLIAEGTMEEKIYQRQVTKLSLAHRILDEYQIERHYTQTNLLELYRYEPLPKNQWEVPKVPKDVLFAEILANSKDIVVSYHEHDSLLENIEEEELTEEERQAAWKDFEEDRATSSQSNIISESLDISTQTIVSENNNENQISNELYMNLVNNEALEMVHQYRQNLPLSPNLQLTPSIHNWVLNANSNSICRIVDVRTLTTQP